MFNMLALVVFIVGLLACFADGKYVLVETVVDGDEVGSGKLGEDTKFAKKEGENCGRTNMCEEGLSCDHDVADAPGTWTCRIKDKYTCKMIGDCDKPGKLCHDVGYMTDVGCGCEKGKCKFTSIWAEP
eukprot:GFUD01081437.1.p1 GENE.GFUD01081437.1~~GFUD01081437.1.p1  ORF type:complete len:128 (+),score=26.73 GFUD01081437.1:92-475(+)